MQIETRHHFCWAWAAYQELQGTPKSAAAFWGSGNLSDILGKFAAVAKAGYFSVGAAGRGLGWASELGGTGSWNHQGGVNGVSQVKGEH